MKAEAMIPSQYQVIYNWKSYLLSMTLPMSISQQLFSFQLQGDWTVVLHTDGEGWGVTCCWERRKWKRDEVKVIPKKKNFVQACTVTAYLFEDSTLPQDWVYKIRFVCIFWEVGENHAAVRVGRTQSFHLKDLLPLHFPKLLFFLPVWCMSGACATLCLHNKGVT